MCKMWNDVNMFGWKLQKLLPLSSWSQAQFGVFFSLCFAFRSQSQCFRVWFESFSGLQMIGSLAMVSSFLQCFLASFLPSSPHLLCLFATYLHFTYLLSYCTCVPLCLIRQAYCTIRRSDVYRLNTYIIYLFRYYVHIMIPQLMIRSYMMYIIV